MRAANNQPTSITGAPPLQADAVTLLAVERTRVAYDRTMMAWIRTAISLLTFGFGIYKFFQLGVGHDYAMAHPHRIGAREFGLAMVTVGLVSLFLGAYDNRKSIDSLKAISPKLHRSKPTWLALLIGVLCVAALTLMFLRA